jgi:hypothetical protein
MIGTIKAYVLAGVSVAVVAGGLWYVVRAERAVGVRDSLEAQLRDAKDDITERDQKIVEKDGEIVTLRTSRDTVNERLATMIADNNAVVDAEVARRRQAEADRNVAREALRIALDNISTVSAHDETFKTWLAQSTPSAAWDQLRAASE